MYPPELVSPMKCELTDIGFEGLESPEEVKQAMQKAGTTLLVVNSVCGCAAGAARPAVRLALENSKIKPDNMVTVFAGVDTDATEAARGFTAPYPPSSPSMGYFKDGQLVHFIERHQIEGNDANAIAAHLQKVFEHFT